MAKFDVDIFVSGQIEADNEIEAEEIAQQIADGFSATSDLLWSSAEVDGVYRKGDED